MPTLKDAKENAPPGEFLAYINPKKQNVKSWWFWYYDSYGYSKLC